MRVRCAWCQEDREESEYYRDKTRVLGQDNVCKPCRQAARRKRYADNYNGVRDRMAATYAGRTDEFRRTQWVQRLWRVYRITPSQFTWLLDLQGGVCALCFESESKVHHNSGAVMRLTIDHDHGCCPSNKRTCGRCIRGMLCYECNLLIGKVEAKPALTERFQDYLGRRPFADVTQP